MALTGHHERDLIFGDVVVRVSPSYRRELHLDTDEGNAAGVRPGDTVTLLSSWPAEAGDAGSGQWGGPVCGHLGRR